TGATVVLGSATPDVVSFYRAERGRYKLLRLPERVTSLREEGRGKGEGEGRTSVPNVAEGNHPLWDRSDRRTGRASFPTSLFPLPSIAVVNLAAELRAGNHSIFSRLLDEALAATLRAGEQAILFLNRRGSASFVLCRDCGHVPRCG